MMHELNGRSGRYVACENLNGADGISDPPSPRLRRGMHRTRRDRGNGAFGISDIEHVAIEGMELLGKAT
jgi:hypothetical protein